MSEPLTERDDSDDREPAPLLGRWSRWYALVIGALAIEIVLLAWLGRLGR